jgi:uroporphyrinogen-III synthase
VSFVRLLVTRPGEDAPSLVAALETMGHEVVTAPLLTIRFEQAPVIPEKDYQAVLITSANGARALAGRPELTRLRSLPVLAVGEASAEAAREAGFMRCEPAEGDVGALAALVRRRLTPQGGPLLHIAGSITAGDLRGDLAADGFEVERAVLYEAVAASHLPCAAARALRAGELDGALFYSPRTARSFATLIREAGLEQTLRPLAAYCLSAAVAGALRDLPFRTVSVADEPSQAAMLRLLAD